MSVRKAKVKRLAFTPPCLAVAKPEPPRGPDWVHEIKFDGYRVQALIEGRNVRLLTRNEIDWTSRFGIVVDDFAALGVPMAAIDCEAVVFDDAGISRFSALHAELKKTTAARIQMMAFDLLYLDGRNVSALPLLERKLQLERLIADAELPHGLLRYSSHMQGDGLAILDTACAMGLEGIVSKRTDLAYHSGRIGDWTKSKCLKADPFVVIGYVPSKATTGIVGSLVLGFYENGQLVYAGRVGSGFTGVEARAMADSLSTITVGPPPLARSLTREQRSGVRWVEPRLVAQIAYRDVTADRLLRHANFEHFREDKRPGEIMRPPALAY
ncbi:MAG: non-homologous end-joining DNA ligase [Hyphomicrobiaceae bacterium]